jgi:hypothetical protein
MKANRVTSKRIAAFYTQKFDAIYARINEMTESQLDDEFYNISIIELRFTMQQQSVRWKL